MQEPQFVEWTTGRFHAFLCQIVANLMQAQKRYERIA